MVEGDVNQAKKSFMGMPVSSFVLFRSSHVHQDIIIPIDIDALNSQLALVNRLGELAMLQCSRASFFEIKFHRDQNFQALS